MGTTKEQQNEGDAAAAAAAVGATHTAPTQHQRREEEEEKAKTLPTPSVVIIPAAQGSTMATNAAKKIRRAFSMPRNPFRWSRKFKTAAAAAALTTDAESGAGKDKAGERRGSHTAISSCVSGGRGRSGSIVSLSSYEAAPGDASATTTTNTNANCNSSNNTNNSNINSNKRARVLRRSSFKKFLNRIAQHLSATVNVGSEEQSSAAASRVNLIDIVPFYTGCWRRKEANKHRQTNGLGSASSGGGGGGDRVPPIGGYQWPPDQTPGVMGLKNHGNTCFMNAVLQCLSHTDILAEYFVLDQYKADLKRRNKINSRKFGTKGELTEQLANVLKALWTCRNESDHSTGFKAVVDRYGTQFRSSTQHDAQEFLFWLLDKVHEDLNTASKRRYKSIKNSYGRSDEIIAAETLANHIRCNNSFVQAVFQAQFRSSLTCPRCKKQSNTFDPFHCISVQLPQLTQQTIFVTVVYMKQQPRQIKMGLRVPAGSPIVALREQLQTDTGIAGSRMVLVDLNAEGFTHVFYDTQPVETLSSIESIYCIEVPEAEAESPRPQPKTAATPKASSSPSAPEAAEKITSAPATAAAPQADLLLLVANVYRAKDGKDMTRFGAPFSMKAPRDCSYQDLQKRMLREMSPLLKPEVFSYATPLADMFRIRLQDPSADPDTYLEQVEHPLLTEMIDMALTVLASEAGPPHIKLLLEWSSPEEHFLARQQETDDEAVVEHESVARLSASKAKDTAALTLEQCLEHYTKAETLSAEDAWRCPHCQQYLPVVKTLGLWSLPDILVVHFKRFRQHQSKGPQAAKLTTMVKFPLTAFDMSPHLAKGVHESATSSSLGLLDGGGRGSNLWKRARSGDSRSSTLNSRCDPKDTRYDLYAVCYHQGDTLETGHYTAACKNPYDRQWYKFDDQRVSKVPEDDIEQDIINNEAYMLFYQRRSVDAAECSGSSSNSGDHWVSRIAPAPASATSSSAASTSGKENDGAALKADAGSSEVAESGPAAEKAQSKPVHIPLVGEEVAPEITEPAVQEEHKLSAHELPLNIEELAFADADADVSLSEDTKNERIEATPEPSQISAAAATEPKAAAAAAAAATIEEVTHIFAMDEEQKEEPMELSMVINGSEILPESLPVAEVVRTNGHASPSSSSASSESSLSSRSSPRSLTTSVTATSTLQSKLNGHMNSACSGMFNGNGNGNATVNGTHPQLSSSLQLTRQVLSNHNWHGSRSSVSAVENATHQQQKQQAAAAASLSLRHSFSTSSNYKLRECTETLSSLLRNSTNTCSKDTLLFIDQQSHHHTSGLIEDDDDSYMGRSLWISPVTPHKLITVSPKN
ncbi:ubiquitin carboxyl-terminal hydrolase 43 isoform X1 [Drosophila subobscura]|uniref:ubiquitin carboxyl-terminal hydrolase 43 isoform X1 n=1 Tax=Drosophila subobscura TaxID=7241 RepID=UPI00155A8830|nr:ubiquitin carboxyl-terminal hydrolase 43 isoform X1 [Drosophila subobscura]